MESGSRRESVMRPGKTPFRALKPCTQAGIVATLHVCIRRRTRASNVARWCGPRGRPQMWQCRWHGVGRPLHKVRGCHSRSACCTAENEANEQTTCQAGHRMLLGTRSALEDSTRCVTLAVLAHQHASLHPGRRRAPPRQLSDAQPAAFGVLLGVVGAAKARSLCVRGASQLPSGPPVPATQIREAAERSRTTPSRRRAVRAGGRAQDARGLRV